MSQCPTSLKVQTMKVGSYTVVWDNVYTPHHTNLCTFTVAFTQVKFSKIKFEGFFGPSVNISKRKTKKNPLHGLKTIGV